jgi:hypothetical protein
MSKIESSSATETEKIKIGLKLMTLWQCVITRGGSTSDITYHEDV